MVVAVVAAVDRVVVGIAIEGRKEGGTVEVVVVVGIEVVRIVVAIVVEIDVVDMD